jgi:hypothetical protein
MITPCMLVAGHEHEGLLGTPEMDPLTEQGALQDAQLVEVMFDAVSRRLGWLLDLRMAFQLRMANTGLVVFEQVEGFGWVGKNTSVARVAWPVDDSIPNARESSSRCAAPGRPETLLLSAPVTRRRCWAGLSLSSGVAGA